MSSVDGRSEPAILGGAPLLSSPRSTGQLPIPAFEGHLALVRKSYDAGYLSRRGPAVVELEQRLAQLHGVEHVVAVASATLGLILTLRVVARDGPVVMPSFTYPGLPHIARWAGHLPAFADVDPLVHTLTPESVRAPLVSGAGAILFVCNHNDFGDFEGIERAAERFGVPVVFDAVDALGGAVDGAPVGRQGRACVFSLHATKALNGYEGGFVATNDGELAASLRWLRDGGTGARPPGLARDVRPLTVPLNEMHACMALGCIDGLAARIDALRRRHSAYAEMIRTLPGLRLLPVRDDEHVGGAFAKAVVEVVDRWPLTRDETVAALRAENAMSTPYYTALHRSAHAPLGLPVADLPVTDALAERFFHLPWGESLTFDEISRIGDRLRIIAERAGDIRRVLRSA